MHKEDFLIQDGEIESLRLSGLRTLHCVNFRNLTDVTLDFAPRYNLITGPNAQGKTNSLEAIYLCSTARLLRGSRDQEAIQDGKEFFRVACQLMETDTEIAVSLSRGSRKKASINGLDLPRGSDLLGRMPCVCMSASDLPLVYGDPSERRLFLDLELSQLYSAYLRSLSLYKRALEQRNALLKLAQTTTQPAEVFEVWESHLSEHGAILREYRRDYLEKLTLASGEVHAFMGQNEALELVYVAKDAMTGPHELTELYAERRGEEVHRGSTLFGPHRDDFQIQIESREARYYGSQGQQRTAVIALKLGSLALLNEKLKCKPLLLLDDVLSDLDIHRRARLSEWILNHAGQTVLTCTEPEAAGSGIMDQAKIFRVKEGNIYEE